MPREGRTLTGGPTTQVEVGTGTRAQSCTLHLNFERLSLGSGCQGEGLRNNQEE